MRTDQILSADLIDIVFEHRNKTYGAYDLRKFYGNRLGMALGITFLMAAAAFLSLKYMNLEKSALAKVEVPDIFVGKVYDVIPVEIPVPPKVEIPKQQPTVKAPSQKFVANVVITKDEKLGQFLESILQSYPEHKQRGYLRFYASGRCK